MSLHRVNPRGSRHIVHRHHVGCVRRLLRVGSCGSRFLRFELFERLRRLRRFADDLCGGATGAGLCRTGHACTVPRRHLGHRLWLPSIGVLCRLRLRRAADRAGADLCRQPGPGIQRARHHDAVPHRSRPRSRLRSTILTFRTATAAPTITARATPIASMSTAIRAGGGTRIVRWACATNARRFREVRTAKARCVAPRALHNPRAVSVGAIAAYAIALCAM